MDFPLVVGVDGSDASLVAVDWAADEAAWHGWSLRIVYASSWERYEGAAPTGSTDRPADQVLAESTVETAGERAGRRRPGLTVTTEVLAEGPSEGLLREGDEAAVLAVGSRGRNPVADLLLGSVSLVVAARAHCPVVVVRGDRQALEARHQRILLGVGSEDVNSPAVRFAFREASVRDVELEVLHAWRRPAHEPVEHPLLTGDVAEHAQSASELLDRAVAAMVREHPRVRLRRSPVEGAAHRVLAQRSAAADLLVVGARHRSRLVGLEIGKVAHRALHHASCPVAIVPRGRAPSGDGDP
ncbi:universal stress protein [Streptomyces sp. NPDC002530]